MSRPLDGNGARELHGPPREGDQGSLGVCRNKGCSWQANVSKTEGGGSSTIRETNLRNRKDEVRPWYHSAMPDPTPPQTIGFRLEGSVEDGGRVRFRDLLEFLHRLRATLKRLEETVTGAGRPAVYYRIVDMEVSSAAIMLEAVPERLEEDPTSEILRRVDTGLTAILEDGPAPPWFDRELLETFKGLTAPLRRHVRGVHILRPARTFTLSRQFEVSIDRILGEDITSVGSISGFLDAINVHGVRHFHVYPLIGPSKVLCVFPEELLPDVRKGLKRHVIVSGVLRYKLHEAFPYQVDVESIEVLPLAEELPTLRSLRGIAPGAAGAFDSVAFVRRLRDAFEA